MPKIQSGKHPMVFESQPGSIWAAMEVMKPEHPTRAVVKLDE